MAQKAKDNQVDLVLLAGDLADAEGSVEGLIGPFKEQGIEIGVVPGNHEG